MKKMIIFIPPADDRNDQASVILPSMGLDEYTDENSKNTPYRDLKFIQGEKGPFTKDPPIKKAINKGIVNVNDPEQSLYIIGHGSAGNNIIRIGSSLIGTDLTSAQLVTSLIENGLDKNFCGKLKLWICESGASFENNPALATLVLHYLRQNGFLKCKVYGYREKINCSTYPPEKINNTPFKKSGVISPEFQINGEIIPGNKFTVRTEGKTHTITRARNARIEFMSD